MSIVSSFKFILPLLLIPLILVTVWFRNGLIIGGGEEGLVFYNPSKSLELSGTWMEYVTGVPNLGSLPRITLFYPLSFLIELLHIPNFILQAGTFFILLGVGILSVYSLTLNLLSQHQFRHKIAFVSSIFYLLNPFSISQIWGRSITDQYFSFVLLPLSILIFLIGLKKRKYIFTIFLTLVSIFFSTAFGFVTFLMTYWVVLVLTLVYWVMISKQKKKDLLFGLSFFVLSLILFIIGHFWWLQGYILASSSNTLSERLGDAERNLGTLTGVSRNFTPDLVIRLLQRSYFSEVGYYGKIYVSLPFQLISLIPPIFVIFGLIQAFKIIELKNFRFFVILFVLGLFVSSGANPPFGWLFVWIFKNISFLQPFRNPYEKFGLVYVLGYAPLFALGTVYFFQQRFKILGILAILILTCGIFAWPMWTGRIHAVLDKKIGIPVPAYYQDLSEFLNKQGCCLHNKNSKDYRIFMTPLWGGDSSSYLWEDKIYQGIDPALYLLSQPAISNTLQAPYYYDFISNIRRYMERINLAPSLALLRTKYFVDRGDAVMIPEGDKLHYKFLTSAVQPPNDISTLNRSICENMQDSAKIICQIPDGEQDFKGIRYLHLEILTDVPASLDIAIRDKKEVRSRWEGKKVSEYQTENSWVTITIPLNAPTEYNYQLDLSNIYLLEVLAYPKDSQQANIGSITLRGVKLDPGREVETNEFRLIKTFGKLNLYEPNNFKSPPEFGSLSKINKIEDFVQLFQIVNQKRNSIDEEGFLILSQNPKKDLSDFLYSDLKIVNKSKISETRYWIETDQNSNEGFILLSKTFNPQWKAIPDTGKNELDGSFGNDIKLLKKQFLPESNHYVVNGYANLWKIENKNNQYAIVFMPQIMADIGAKVSVFSVLIVIGFTAIWVVRKQLFV